MELCTVNEEGRELKCGVLVKMRENREGLEAQVESSREGKGERIDKQSCPLRAAEGHAGGWKEM